MHKNSEQEIESNTNSTFATPVPFATSVSVGIRPQGKKERSTAAARWTMQFRVLYIQTEMSLDGSYDSKSQLYGHPNNGF
jgi:hypothetical protein